MVALRRLRRSKGGSGRSGKLRATSNPTYESRIQVALNGLENDLYKSVAAAARAQNVCYHCSYHDIVLSLTFCRYPVQLLMTADWERTDPVKKCNPSSRY